MIFVLFLNRRVYMIFVASFFSLYGSFHAGCMCIVSSIVDVSGASWRGAGMQINKNLLVIKLMFINHSLEVYVTDLTYFIIYHFIVELN